jgi:hypothetical protein
MIIWQHNALSPCHALSPPEVVRGDLKPGHDGTSGREIAATRMSTAGMGGSQRADLELFRAGHRCRIEPGNSAAYTCGVTEEPWPSRRQAVQAHFHNRAAVAEVYDQSSVHRLLRTCLVGRDHGRPERR